MLDIYDRIFQLTVIKCDFNAQQQEIIREKRSLVIENHDEDFIQEFFLL